MSGLWTLVRYEADGEAIYMVIEFNDGHRMRVLVRDAEGNYQW